MDKDMTPLFVGLYGNFPDGMKCIVYVPAHRIQYMVETTGHTIVYFDGADKGFQTKTSVTDIENEILISRRAVVEGLEMLLEEDNAA